MTLASLRLYSPDRTAALLTPEETAALLGPLRFSARYGEPEELSTRSFAFAPGAAALTDRAALRTVHRDPSAGTGGEGAKADVVRWWRGALERETVGEGGPEVHVRWRPLWVAEAEDAVARPAALAVLGERGTVDLTLRLVDRSLPGALAEVLDPANGAPTTPSGAALLTVGLLDGALATAPASLLAHTGSTLAAVEALAGSVPGGGAVYSARVLPGGEPAEERYALDFFEPPEPGALDPPVLTVRLAEDGSDARRFARRGADAAERLSVLLPQSGTAGNGPPASVAGNRFAVASSSYDAATDRLTLDLSSRKLVWEPGALVGLTAEVLGTAAVLQIVETAAPATVVLAGGAGLSPSAVRLRAAGGGPLVALPSPALLARLGRAERARQFPDVGPLANVLTEPGGTASGPPERVSADLSEWTETGDRPLGVYKVVNDGSPQAPSFTREESPELVHHGGAGLRVVAAAAGDGAAVDAGPYRDDAGAWASVRVLSGSVALRLVQYDPGRGRNVTVIQAVATADGAGSGSGGLASAKELAVAVSADRFPAITADGLQPLLVELVAEGGPAEWVLDAVTLVRAPQAAPYAPLMGPAALLEAAAAHLAGLVRLGSADAFEGEWLRFTGSPTDRDLRPGDPARLRLTLASGTADHDVVCLGLEYEEAVGRPPAELRGQFGAAPRSLRDAVEAVARVEARVDAPGAVGGVAGFDVPPLPFVETRQLEGAEADVLAVEVGVPTGEGSGSSAHVELADDAGGAGTGPNSPVQSRTVTAAEFAAAAAAGQSSVTVRLPLFAGGPHTARAVPVRHGVEGPPTVVPLVVDASAPGTTSRSLPPARGLRWRAGSQAAYVEWDPFLDGRVAAAEVLAVWADAAADLVGPPSAVLARPHVGRRRSVVGGRSNRFVHRYEFDARGALHRFFVAALSAGSPGLLAVGERGAVVSDDAGGYFLAPNGLPIVLRAGEV